MSQFEPFKVAMDLNLMKVGDPMIQAAMGGSSRLLDRLPQGAWLSYATPDLHLYTIAGEAHFELAVMVLESRAGKW